MIIGGDVDEQPSRTNAGGPAPYELAYRQLFEWSCVATALVGADGRVRQCNRALEDLLGYHEADLRSMPFAHFTYPDDLVTDAVMFASLLRGERQGYTLEKRFVRKDGRIITGRLSMTIAANRDHGPVLAQVIDITAERRIHDDRRKILHDLRERIKEITAIHDAAGLILDDRLGIEGVLQRVVTLLPPAMQYPEVSAVKVWYGDITAATPGFIEAPFLGRPGSELFAPIRTRDGTTGGVRLAYVEDRPNAADGPFLVEERRLIDSIAEVISATLDRRVSDIALERSNQHLKLAQTVANVGVWEWDQKTDRISWSEQLEAIAGLAPGSFAGTFTYFMSLVHPSDRDIVTAAIRQTVEDPSREDRFEAEYRICRPDRSYRWVASTGRLFRDADGVPLRMLGMAHDITGVRELERRYQESQKMDALGRLAGGVAHDFNNLLSVIRGYTDFIAAELPDHVPMQNDLTQIVEATERAAALTRQLLAFSRKQVAEPQVVNPTTVVTGMEKLLRRLLTPEVNFMVGVGPEDLRVRIDPGQLEQVILNLVVNARDAMPKGGQLNVTVGRAQFDEPIAWEHAALPAGDFVMLTVSDTGVGMSDETKQRLFEPFYTTKEAGRGTGLGLATVYGIVQQNGGGIWVYSEPNMGSTFKVYLPAVAAVDDVTPRTLPDDRPVTGTETVLIVDDEPHLRALAERAFRGGGYVVHTAADGLEALEMVEGNNLRPDVLVTDIVMPGMRGPLLAAELRNRIPQLRVVFVTGYTEDVLEQENFTGAYRILQKPFGPRDMLRVVRDALDAGG